MTHWTYWWKTIKYWFRFLPDWGGFTSTETMWLEEGDKIPTPPWIKKK